MRRLPSIGRVARVVPLAVMLAAASVGCGQSATKGSVQVRSGSASLFAGQTARLSAATTALEQVVGHPVAIEVDGALASGHESSFGWTVTQEIETLAQSLAARKRSGGAVFAGVLADFGQLEVRYDTMRSSRKFNPGRRLVTLRVRVGEAWEAAAPIFDESNRRFDARYGAMAPERVPSDELEVFAWWLGGQAEDNDPARAMRGIVSLIAVEPKLAPEARRSARLSLLEGMAQLRRGRDWGKDYGKASPVDGATTQAFATWARANLTNFTPDELERLILSVAAEPSLPGLDPLAMIDAAADVWTRAGRPVLPFGESEAVLATYPPLVQRTIVPGMVGHGVPLYAALAERTDALDALFRRLSERGDPVLRDVVSMHLFEATCSRGEVDACQRVRKTACRPEPKAKGADRNPELSTRLTWECKPAGER